ncbi:sugar transferase [Demequina soli]|uniref:sugar transferase n=1 Tax=Demequina soli TaxID=1638987 RepID=UPI0009E6037F|nr:sugar transferase [Demequina soli]
MNGPRGWARKYEVRLALSDAFVVTLVMVGAHAARFGWDLIYAVAGPSGPAYWRVTAAIGLLWWTSLTLTRSREARILGHGTQEFQRVVAASWWAFATIAILGFVLQWNISRGYLLVALPVGTLVLLVYRLVWRAWIHSQRDEGALTARVLVVGPLRTSEQMIRRLRQNPRAGYSVVGVCVPAGADSKLSTDLVDVPVFGAIKDSVETARKVGAEFLLLSGTDAISLREARRIGWQLEGTGVGLIVAPAMVDVAGPRVQFSPVQGLPLLHVDGATFSGAKYWFKESFDKITAVILLTLLAVPMAAVGILVRITSPGPIIFRQERIGKDGAPFAMLKFRSMVPDAEYRVGEVMGGDVRPFYKRKDDPRITPFGRFMRRYSIDELPQVLNVIKGDMSIVGPRPQVAAEVEHYGDIEHRRLLVKPGMTGLWQVSGRSSLSPEDAIRLDAYYAENWSLGGDLVILLKTVEAVIGRNGAY